MSCVDSRKREPENSTYRRYECRKCARRITTCETVVLNPGSGGMSVAKRLHQQVKRECLTEVLQEVRKLLSSGA